MSRQATPRTEENERRTLSGYLMVTIGLALIALAVFFFLNVGAAGPGALLYAVPLVILGSFVLAGLCMLQPNEAALLLHFGAYEGTDRADGLRWANPFYRKQKISLRAQNLASERLKVNDRRGNPIEIAQVMLRRQQAEAIIAAGGYGEQPARGAVLGGRGPARHQHGHALPVGSPP
jgi:hypothetical protein